VYATGLIPDAGTIGTNMFAPLDSDVTITSPVIVGVNNAGIPQAPTVIYARGLIGVWEVRFVVPSKAPPNKNTPFVIAVPVNGKLVFAKGTTLPIQ